jgi:hypothetical protein
VEKVITFDGTGAALLGEEALKAQDLEVRVMARPNALGAQCGFCLRVGAGDLRKATRILRRARLPISGVYDKIAGPDGRWVYQPIPPRLWLAKDERAQD